MPQEHIVKPGECLSSIAQAYGFGSYSAVYMDAANDGLRRQRPNPNLVCAGDRVVIPRKQAAKTVPIATGQSHRFTVQPERVMLCLLLKDARGQAIAGRPYLLQVAGRQLRGKTGPDGRLEAAVPADALSGQLTIWRDAAASGPGRTIQLKIGYLDPHDTLSGAQSRLNNLGIRCGAADGVLGPRTRHALRVFQARHRLAVSGDADAPTLAKLRELHDGAAA